MGDLREAIATALHSSDDGQLHDLTEHEVARMADAVLAAIGDGWVERSEHDEMAGQRDTLEGISRRLLDGWVAEPRGEWRLFDPDSHELLRAEPISPAEVAWFTKEGER